MNAYQLLAERNKMRMGEKLAYAHNIAAPMSKSAGSSQKSSTDFLENIFGDSKDNRFLKGIAYAGSKVATGALQSIEGIWDYTASGIAKWAGNDEWAEKNMQNDWIDYSAPDTWYQPSNDFERFVGDVFGGVGSSLPSIAAVGLAAGITYATAGTALPMAASMATAGITAGLGAAGNATKQAYRETGELGGKEFGYGALVGATEGAIEGATSLIGVGTGKLAKMASGNVTKSVTKGLGKTLLSIGADALSEGAEEVVSEFLDSRYQRLTYNPNAKDATLEELAYVGLVGAMSGLFMTGTTGTINASVDTIRGAHAVSKGKADSILAEAKALTEFEDAKHTETEVYENLSSAYKKLSASLEKTGGEVRTLNQKRMLGGLAVLNASARVTPMIYREAANLVAGADTFAEQASSKTIMDENGKELKISAEAIREGYDPKNPKSLKKALKNNATLRALAIASATGKILYNSQEGTKNILSGRELANDTEYNALLENANEDELTALSSELGVEDWNTEDSYSINNKLRRWYSSEKGTAYREKQAKLTSAKTLAATADTIPTPVKVPNGQTLRYTTENVDIAIENNDNNFTIYDLKDNLVSKTLTRAETNKALRTINEGLNARESENITATALSDNVSGIGNNARTVSDNASAVNEGERFAISQKTEEQISNYQKRIDSWDGQTEGFSFVMGDTPTYLSEIEVSGKRVGKKQVRIDATKIKSIMNEHPEMTRDVIKNLPHLLNDPIVVLDSKTVSGRLVLLGEVYANNRPVMMALEINPSTRSGNSTYVDVIKVASAYTRSNTQNLINSSNIRFINENKNRVNDWLKVNRLQLPLPNSQSDSGTISIPQTTKKSNSFSEKTSENSSDNTKKTKYQLEAEEFDRLANKEVEGYKKLSEPNRAMIRKILRQAKARGMSEADALSLARISAHSGVDIVIGKEYCKRTGLDENGKTVVWYADGFYSERTGKIYVNPESTRNYSSLLVHEFLHASKSMTGALKSTKKVYTRLLELAKSSMSDADIKAIEERYSSAYGNKQQLIDEEIIAEYGETFAGEQFISSLLSDEPTLFEKLLAHFRGASKDYAADPRLSREARRFYKLYKKMFDNLAAVKQNTNAVGGANALTNRNSENMHVSEGNDMLAMPNGIDNYTEEQYNNFGWANEAGGITFNETNDLYSKIQAKRSLREFPQSSRGEAIIEVNNKPHTTLDTNNVFVFVKGTKNNFYISRTVRFNAETETEMEILKEDLYEGRTCSDTHIALYQAEGLAREYRRENFPTFAEYREGRSNRETRRGTNQNNRGREKYRSGYSLTTGEDGEIIEKYALPEGLNVVKVYEPKSLFETITDAAKGAPSGFKSAILKTQIHFTDQQAGIIKAGSAMGYKDADADVQAVRAASNRAQAMLSDKQAIRRNGKLVEVGDGLYNILAPIKKLGTQVWVDFQDFLFHRHNISRMSLDKRSIERINAEKEKLSRMTNELIAKSAELKALNAEIASLNGVSGRDATVKRQSLTEKRKALNAEKRALTASCKALEKTISEMKVEENKPIFGYEKDGEKIAYTAEESRLYAEELSRRYPDFKKYAEKVYSYLDNLQKERLDAGLISEELYNELKEKYPYYVPTMRAEAPSGTAGIGGKYNLAVKQTVKTAKGSFRDLESLELSISRMTEEVIRAAEVNRLALSLAKAAESSGDVRFIDLEGMESGGKVTADSVNEQIEERKPVPVKQNQITMYRNGEQLTVSVAPEVFAGFDAWNPKVDMAALPIEAMAFANKTFKRLVTSLNPFFLVRNAIRDIQDAGINTRFPLKFVKNYARAVVEITKNGELWRMYREAGGLSSTVFDYNKGFKAKPTKMGFTASENKILALFGKMETINMFIEQLPRLAEFISSVEAGNTVNRALLDSADVTTNFARVGKTAKELNRTVIPFLNPAIQGMSKIVRNFSEAFDYRHPRQAVKAFAVLSIKAMLLGIVPQVLNQLMYEDDEDYEELRDSDKETYFLLKIGDTFFKLPKGRVSAVLAGAVNRTSQAVKGESVDWADYVKSISSNVTPIENFSRTIFQPFFEFFTNTTWYGGQIEGQEFDNVRPRDRYDESTSSIAIALGKTFNYSPKKIHYLLDQYSGVIGDFFLPLTTQQVENGVSGNVILDTAFSNFTVDPVTQNKLSSEFYDIYEETMYAKTEGDISAKYKLKYLNSVKSAISELYDERVKIQTSNLTSYEKLQQTRVIQALINETYRSATASLDTFAQAIRATEGIYDETDPAGEKMRYTEITRICFGAEKALEKYGASVYKSAESFKKAGISYEDYYNLYFSTKDITSDITVHGETVSGSKRAKMLTAINRTGLDVRERMLYFTSRGYSIKDGDFGGMTAIRAKKMLLSYILSQPGLTSAEKAELAEKCGFEVKNGRIITPKS